MDCLRVLTAGNELNKLALFGIPVGVRRLIQIMATSQSPVGLAMVGFGRGEMNCFFSTA